MSKAYQLRIQTATREVAMDSDDFIELVAELSNRGIQAEVKPQGDKLFFVLKEDTEQ